MKKPELKEFIGSKGYEELNFLPFNRDFKLRPKLLTSMRESGFINPINLIYTDLITGVRELYVVDGQHRALAAQFLNIPFYGFVQQNDITSKKELIQMVAKLNNTSVAWKAESYCRAYATLGMEDFQILLKLSKLYGFSVTTLAALLSGARSRKTHSSQNLKDGTFKIRNEQATLETLALAKELGVDLTSRMLTAFHILRLSEPNFVFAIFKLNFIQNYEALKAEKLDDYIDVFKTYL